MTHEEIVRFFKLQQEHYRNHDPEGLASGHAEDCVVISPIFRTVRGRKDILQSYRSLFQTFPDWNYIGEEVLADGDRVAQPFLVTATHSGEFMGLMGSGRKVDIHGVIVFEMRDGLIAYERRYYDFTGLLIQLGILRGRPARPEISVG